MSMSNSEADVDTGPVSPEKVTVSGASEARGRGEDPTEWSPAYKWTVVSLVAIMTMIDVFATIIILPVVSQVLEDFDSSNDLYSVLLVSIWEVGEGLGPFVLAPLSEVFGRLKVFHTANICFLVFIIACALSTSIRMLIAFRFLSGFSVPSLILGPAIVGDMFSQEMRGVPMAALNLPVLLGPVLAPVIGGYLGEARGWRWNFWLIAMSMGAFQVAAFLTLSETFPRAVIEKNLLRSAEDKTIREHSQSPSRSRVEVFREAILRPLKMMFLSPTIFALSLYTAVGYGFSYIILTTINMVYQTRYGFSEGNTGLIYLVTGLGMIFGVLFCGLTSDRTLQYLARDGEMKPEYRLQAAVLGGIFLPIGLLIYGWTAQYHSHWIIPLISTGLVGFGVMLLVVPVENYMVDAYTEHSASAVTGGVVFRAFFGAFLPLIGPPLNSSLGLGWGSSVLAFIALALLPIPLMVFRLGSRRTEDTRGV